MASIAALGSLSIALGAKAPLVAFEETSHGLSITIGGKPFATYCKPSDRISRPYFANVKTPSGAQVTRNHPPIEGVDSMDHDTYHPGAWLTFAGINGNDYWRLKKRVKFGGFVGEPRSGAGEGSFAVRNVFLDSADLSGDPVAQEISEYRILAREGYYLLISQSRIFSEQGDLVIGDDQEYGFGIRVQTGIEERHGGRILNAEGREGEEKTYGRATPWCDYSGMMDGQLIGVTLVTDPLNFRPSWFHSRDYGLIAANPFGRRKVAGGSESQVMVKQGEQLSLGFGLAIYSANSEAEVDRDAMYQDYLKVIYSK